MYKEIVPGDEFFSFELNDNSPKYGLLCPITDQFLFISGDKLVATQLCLLLSSKIHLVPIRIDTAENYKFDLIDNSCCYFWTLEDKSQNEFLRGLFDLQYNQIINYTGYLKAKENSVLNINIIKIRNFLFLGNYVLNTFNSNVNVYVSFGKNFIPTLDNSEIDNLNLIKNSCIRTIYTTNDLDTATAAVKKYLLDLKKYT